MRIVIPSLLAAVFALSGPDARAAVFNWTGAGGASDQWSNGANWTGGVAPTNSSATDLLFSVANATASLNDIAGISLNSITFGAGQTSMFSVTGSSLTLFSGMSDASTSTQTVSVGVIGLGAGQSWSAAAGSTMTVTSIVNNAGNLLELGLGGAGGNLILSGIIVGTGPVVVTGPGMTELSGFNLYSGSTTIDGGFLSVHSDINLGIFSSTVVFINGGTLQTIQSISSSKFIYLASGTANIDTFGQTDTLSGSISGAGSLVKIGSGTLTLGGINTFTGGTLISSGTVAISNDNNLGNAAGGLTLNGGALQTLSNVLSARNITLGAGNGTFNAAPGTASTFSGVISGAGALFKTGTGIIALSGANTYAGGTFVNAGTLILSGANTYGGGTTVNGGTLQLGADESLPLNGALTVATGAIFDMNNHNQFLQSLGAVTNNGAINVHAGSLTMNNGYAGTGALVVALQAGAPTITGSNIDTTGGALSVTLVNPNVANGAVFTPISGQIGTCYAGVSSPAALNFAPTCPGGVVTLTVSFVPFASLAATPNQAAVANVLQPLRFAPTGDLVNVFSAFNTLTLSQLQAAFDQIGPISLAAMRGLGLEGSSVQSSAVNQRMTALAKGAGGPASYTVTGKSSYPGTLVASAPGDTGGMPVERKASDPAWGVFGSMIGTNGAMEQSRSASGTQPGYGFSTYGLTMGMDHRLGEHFAAGLSAGYLHGHASIGSPASGTVDNQSARFGVYGTGFTENSRINLYVGGADDAFTTRRDISFGNIQRTAGAAPRGKEINVYAGGSCELWETAYGKLGPFFGANYDRLMIASFSEDGAGSLNLHISPQTAESLRSTLGLKYSQSFGDTTPYVSAGHRHEFVNQSRPIEAQLASGTGSVFSVSTGNTARDGVVIGAGAVTSLGQSTSARIDYSGDFRSHYDENSLNASVRYKF